MNKRSLVGSLIITAALTAGCASAGGGGYANTKAGYDTAVAAAQAAKKKAASVGGEWRDIGKFLKQADKLAASGDFAGAIKLAEKAAWQGKAGYEQAMAEKTTGTPNYMK